LRVLVDSGKNKISRHQERLTDDAPNIEANRRTAKQRKPPAKRRIILNHESNRKSIKEVYGSRRNERTARKLKKILFLMKSWTRRTG
jgi:hypothetical protein